MITRKRVRKTKHTHFIYNNNIMFTLAIIMILSFSIIGSMKLVKADESIQYEKSFQAIEIQQGDTLTSIAQKYACSEADYQNYMEEVIEINQLKDNTIHAGCYLMVPVYTIVSSK